MCELVDFLVNTNNSIARAKEILGEKLFHQGFSFLDEELFYCDGCGLWLERCEEAGECLCRECYTNNEN